MKNQWEGQGAMANPHCPRIKSQLWQSSQVVLVVKNMAASAGDLRDVSPVPG